MTSDRRCDRIGRPNGIEGEGALLGRSDGRENQRENLLEMIPHLVKDVVGAQEDRPARDQSPGRLLKNKSLSMGSLPLNAPEEEDIDLSDFKDQNDLARLSNERCGSEQQKKAFLHTHAHTRIHTHTHAPAHATNLRHPLRTV